MNNFAFIGKALETEHSFVGVYKCNKCPGAYGSAIATYVTEGYALQHLREKHGK